MNVTAIRALQVFRAGSAEDPRLEGNASERRFARCLDCNVIVHYSLILKRWVCDSGRFHTEHMLEFPEEWQRPQESN